MATITPSTKRSTTGKTRKPRVKADTAKKLVPRNAAKNTTATPTPKSTSTAAVTVAPIGKLKSEHKKQKTVRDSFNMPANDYALIGVLKKRAIESARHIKKSELFRAGLKALAAMKNADFLAALAAVDTIKTGRPAKKIK